MAAGAQCAREHWVEKVSVFAVHIFSRATRLFEVEQSRTNPESVRGCSFKQLKQTNALK
jgi:hypothetical protein